MGGMFGVGDQAHPCGDFAGHGRQMALDPVVRKSVQRQVGPSAVLGLPDSVLTPGPAAAADLQIRQLLTCGVVGAACESLTVQTIEAQLRPGRGRSRRRITRTPAVHPLKSVSLVTLATSAPSRTGPYSS